MSEGFELGPFHVPQQSRRDKLRSLEGGTCSSPGLHPLYELTCHHGDAILHHHPSLPPPVKQENSFNLMMGFAPAPDRTVDLPHFSLSSSTPSPSHHHLVDLPPSLPLNPNTTYICPPQDSSHNFRNFEQPLLDSSRPPSFHIPQNSGIMTQGLSLSLSPQTFNREASVIPADKAMNSYIVIGGGGDVSRSIGPLGPFTGYAEVLKGSRFLKPAQQLLEASCDVGQRAYMEGISAADVEVDRLINTVIAEDPSGIGSSGGDHGEHHRRKTRLVSMLNEVCRGYKYYYQQMQAVVASFESVHGLNKAVPFTPLALKTLSRNFRNLKNAIATQLRSTCKARVADSSSKDDESHFRVAEQNLEHQRIAQASSVYEQPHVWRPQRGLPERAVSLLRAWLYEHFLHPYPTDSDKHMLAKQTGLSRNQVSNWFINARVRLWKPMVEEIHMLEMRQSQKAHECRDQDVNKQGSTSNMQSLRSHELFQANTGRNDRKSCAENQPGHQELSGLPSNGAEPINFSYDNIPAQRNSAIQVGVGHQMGGGNAGISLTLGLHQGNGACLPESYPLSVAHFGLGGLGSSSSSYAGFGGITGQIRHFDGQLLHDFVG